MGALAAGFRGIRTRTCCQVLSTSALLTSAGRAALFKGGFWLPGCCNDLRALSMAVDAWAVLCLSCTGPDSKASPPCSVWAITRQQLLICLLKTTSWYGNSSSLPVISRNTRSCQHLFWTSRQVGPGTALSGVEHYYWCCTRTAACPQRCQEQHTQTGWPSKVCYK